MFSSLIILTSECLIGSIKQSLLRSEQKLLLLKYLTHTVSAGEQCKKTHSCPINTNKHAQTVDLSQE